MGRHAKHYDHRPPRVRQDLDTGARRAHSRTGQRPVGPTFDSRHYTHEHVFDLETGASHWVRKVHDSDRALGPTLVAALLDARATPEDIERAALAARDEVVTWRDPFTGDMVVSARGVALNRWARYLRRRARHLAHLERVAQRDKANAASAPRAPRPRAVPLEEVKARARADAAQRAEAERRRVEEAEARAVSRALAEAHKAAKAARRQQLRRVRVKVHADS